MTTAIQKEEGQTDISVHVEPGICGFDCTVKAYRIEKRTVKVEIEGSECKQIQRLAAELGEFGVKELFMPLTRNPVYAAAEKAGCHSSCAIPAAVLKAVEAAMGMAIARDVRITFESQPRGSR